MVLLIKFGILDENYLNNSVHSNISPWKKKIGVKDLLMVER